MHHSIIGRLCSSSCTSVSSCVSRKTSLDLVSFLREFRTKYKAALLGVGDIVHEQIGTFGSNSAIALFFALVIMNHFFSILQMCSYLLFTLAYTGHTAFCSSVVTFITHSHTAFTNFKQTFVAYNLKLLDAHDFFLFSERRGRC